MSKRPFVIAGFVLLGLVLVAGLGAFVYYQSLRSTPQYSLALLVDSAKRDDKAEIAKLVDIDGVVDDFVPQITNKAVELYGRGQPPEVLRKVATLALPLLPAVKERARAELPRVIRDRTARFGSVPFFAMVMGAEKYLDISINGDIATIKSKLPEHQLEMKMKKNGDRWQIVGVRDEQLATAIARKVGQEIMAVAVGGRSGGRIRDRKSYGITETGRGIGQIVMEKPFETSLAELETIVGRLENGDLPLEESLELFEQGIKLSRECRTRLTNAERRIEILMKDADGELTAAEFDPETTRG